MIQIPTILSQKEFEGQVLPNIDEYEDTFFISILQPDEKEPLREDSENYKTFWIYDIPESIGSYKAFNYEDAQKMYKYIMSNYGKKLVVHCAIGVSRSPAVAEFYFEMQGGAYKQLIEKYPNILPNLTPILLYLRMAEKEKGEDIQIKF